MRLKVKHQFLIAAILAILILVGFGFFLWMPKLQQLGELNNRVEKKKDEIEKAERTVNDLKRQLKELPQVEAKLEEIKVKMPAEPGLSSLLREIQRVSDEAGVDFVSIKPEATTQKGQYAELPMEVVISGYFFDVIDFLYRLYTLPREMKVNSVSIEEGEDQLPHLKATIGVSAFMIGQAPQTGTSKETTTKSSSESTETPSKEKTEDTAGGTNTTSEQEPSP